MDAIQYVTQTVGIRVARTGKVIAVTDKGRKRGFEEDISETELGKLIWSASLHRFGKPATEDK